MTPTIHTWIWSMIGTWNSPDGYIGPIHASEIGVTPADDSITNGYNSITIKSLMIGQVGTWSVYQQAHQWYTIGAPALPPLT
jgi:hypothetical protein